MMDQNLVFRTIESNKPALSNFGISRLGLFGSFARNQQNENSDFDILVEFAQGKKTADRFLDLVFFLEALFNNKVDLLTPEALTPGMKSRILREVKYFAI